MNRTLSVLNEKLSNQVKVDKKFRITKELIMQISLVLFFSLLVFSVKYNLGIVYIAPFIYFLLLYNTRQAYYTIATISLISLLINYLLFFSVLIGFISLILLIHFNRHKTMNIFFVVFASLFSYLFNTLVKIIELNFFYVALIILLNLAFFTIYNKAFEINHQKKDLLFKEDILAILTFVFNIALSLFTININFFNVGYGFILLMILTLGILTNKVNVIIFSLFSYSILSFSKLNLMGIEVIPFLGLVSAFFPQDKIGIKTFVSFMIAPILYYLGLLTGDVLFTFYTVMIVNIIFYFVFSFNYHVMNNILTPKYEDAKYYQIYVENFREDVSRRLLNFAELFNAFANKSFETNNELIKLDEAIDEMIENHCKNCLKKELCHNVNYIKTYNYFSQLLKEGDKILRADKKRFLDLFGMFCLNAFDVINTAIELNQEYLLGNNSHKHDNLLFQSQLKGLARILQDYAIEVNTDYDSDTIKIEKMRDKMIKLGIDIVFLKVNNIKTKNIDIDFGIRNYEEKYDYLITNLLSDLLKEEIEITNIKVGRSVRKIKITSKKLFDLEFGTSYIGKDGSRISGDNYFKCEMHNGNTIIALSDGMGNGYSAHIESKSTLELLNKMLMTGADDYTAVSIINTLLSLKEYNERFSTLDFVTINKSSGVIEFYKIGSAPSFIIRGNRVIRIDNENLPVGITKDIDKVTFNLDVYDIVVIVSDGVVERFNNINKFEKILVSIMRNNSNQMARDIIRCAINEFGGKIADDMTVIVVKVMQAKNKVVA